MLGLWPLRWQRTRSSNRELKMKKYSEINKYGTQQQQQQKQRQEGKSDGGREGGSTLMPIHSCSPSVHRFHLSNPLLSVEWRVWFHCIHTSVHSCSADTSSQPTDFGYWGPALHSAYPTADSFLHVLSSSLLCDTPPVFKERKTDQERPLVFRKRRECDIASDRGERRGWGHLEGGIRREKRCVLLIYVIAVPHLFIVTSWQLKKDILIAFLLMLLFRLIFLRADHMIWLLPLIAGTHAHISLNNGIYDWRIKANGQLLKAQ